MYFTVLKFKEQAKKPVVFVPQPRQHLNSSIDNASIQVLHCVTKSCEPCELQIQSSVVNTAVKSSNQSLL